mgnify:FL=1
MNRDNWEDTVRKNRKAQEEWARQITDGFVDAPIKENLTGKAKRPEPHEPAKGSSLDQ